MQKLNLSFDFWGTLCESNPSYKEEQIYLASELFDYPESYIKYSFTEMKLLAKKLEERGIQPDRTAMYTKYFGENNIEKFISESNRLFITNPPRILNDIVKLCDKHNCYITSNTFLTHGDTLSKFVTYLFDIPFDNIIFSDEVNCCKPNPEIWKKHNVNFDYHIGDNHKTDGGCEALGIKFLPISKITLIS